MKGLLKLLFGEEGDYETKRHVRAISKQPKTRPRPIDKQNKKKNGTFNKKIIEVKSFRRLRRDHNGDIYKE